MHMNLDVKDSSDGIGVDWQATFYRKDANGKDVAMFSKCGSSRNHEDALMDASMFIVAAKERAGRGG